jgi:hypothetical protein
VLLKEAGDLGGSLVHVQVHVLAVAIERHGDRGVAGERLDALGVRDRLRPDRDAGVSRLVQRDRDQIGCEPPVAGSLAALREESDEQA